MTKTERESERERGRENRIALYRDMSDMARVLQHHDCVLAVYKTSQHKPQMKHDMLQHMCWENCYVYKTSNTHITNE